MDFDHGHEFQPRQPGARSRERRRQRRDRARDRSQGRASASLPRRQHCRRRMPAQSPVRLVVQTDAVVSCAGHLRARALFRRRRAPASDRRWIQVCAARSAGILRRERVPARPRRRHRHCRTKPARRRLFQLSVPLGAQGDQCEKLARDRARRARESIPEIRRANHSLSSLSRQDQSRAVHGHQCRHLRAAALLGAVLRRAGTGMERPRRLHHRGDPRRRAAPACLR